MADGDVVLDLEFEVDTPPGSRVKMFACEDSTRSGGYKYSFQHFDPESRETYLRYDNAHEHPTAGWHHRHTGEAVDPEPIEFNGLRNHIDQFRKEVQSVND